MLKSSASFILIFYVGLRRLGSNNFLNSSYKEKRRFGPCFQTIFQFLMAMIIGNIPITIIRFARYHLLLASNSTFMTDFMCLGTIQICKNLNEHYYYLILTTSMIWQIDADCSLFQSLNMLLFHIRLDRLKLIYKV